MLNTIGGKPNKVKRIKLVTPGGVIGNWLVNSGMTEQIEAGVNMLSMMFKSTGVNENDTFTISIEDVERVVPESIKLKNEELAWVVPCWCICNEIEADEYSFTYHPNMHLFSAMIHELSINKEYTKFMDEHYSNDAAYKGIKMCSGINGWTTDIYSNPLCGITVGNKVLEEIVQSDTNCTDSDELEDKIMDMIIKEKGSVLGESYTAEGLPKLDVTLGAGNSSKHSGDNKNYWEISDKVEKESLKRGFQPCVVANLKNI